MREEEKGTGGRGGDGELGRKRGRDIGRRKSDRRMKRSRSRSQRKKEEKEKECDSFGGMRMMMIMRRRRKKKRKGKFITMREGAEEE